MGGGAAEGGSAPPRHRRFFNTIPALPLFTLAGFSLFLFQSFLLASQLESFDASSAPHQTKVLHIPTLLFVSLQLFYFLYSTQIPPPPFAILNKLDKKKSCFFFSKKNPKTNLLLLHSFFPSLTLSLKKKKKATNVQLGEWSVCGTSHALRLQFRLLK